MQERHEEAGIDDLNPDDQARSGGNDEAHQPAALDDSEGQARPVNESTQPAKRPEDGQASAEGEAALEGDARAQPVEAGVACEQPTIDGNLLGVKPERHRLQSDGYGAAAEHQGVLG